MERASFFLANGCTPLSLSHDFILPADVRPVTSSVSTSITVPVIDLNDKQSLLVKKISDACQEYGFFHIINHGVPEELCRRMMAAVSDFFKLPPEERSHLFTEDKTKPLRVFNFYLKVEGQNKVTMWSETLVHPWHASDDFANFLPRNPPHYRELASEYAKEIGWLMRRLLSLISQGLGLKKDSLRSEDVTGLQVMTKDGEWIAINPLRNAFVVNIGDQIQVLSNGRYKSVHHRAVGSKCSERVSIAMFYGPNKDTVVGPVEELVDEDHPPVYRSYRYEEFLEEFHRQEGTRRRVKEVFELQH
ncbi:protein DMR6-LIKE OXYGENASE 2 isoform X2 [Sesamum indicum]|uniref:Protein DMR6-LIKE OXYGENASE 2 isoform X2 n=1 Tax=Sesamum indicum TaxID=4182 RepID=A0A6I9TYR5_SESIN|nr:protein DMR6-LIKE OXYGENASE 2 isoform X2 [Sesamum indicum]